MMTGVLAVAILVPLALASSMPIPADIEKLVCELATQKQIEEKATEELCSLIHEKFPGIKWNPDCKTVVEGAWDLITSRCPKGYGAMPSPADIEKLVCEVATQKQIEDRATDEVCALISAKFPTIHFHPDCKTVIEGAWDLIASKCPKEQEGFPSPADIEKIVCEVATQKQIEDKAVSEICALVEKKFPKMHFDPDCKTVLTGAWDLVVARCPKAQEPMPSPEDMEKIVCDLINQKPLEAKVTYAGCALIQQDFPSVHFNPDCETVMQSAWDAIAAQCPTANVAVPIPDDIKKLACEVAKQKGIERKATKGLCTAIHAELPDIPMSVCNIILRKEWDKLAAKCPKDLDAIVV